MPFLGYAYCYLFFILSDLILQQSIPDLGLSSHATYALLGSLSVNRKQFVIMKSDGFSSSQTEYSG